MNDQAPAAPTGTDPAPLFDVSPINGRYALRLVDAADYWAHYRTSFKDLEFPDITLDPDRVVRDSVLDPGLRPLAVHAMDGDRVAAALFCYDAPDNAYYMRQAIVHPDHRRGGLYSTLARRALEVSRKLGRATVYSHHALSNNPIIIAKLKLGFYITAFEVDARLGHCLRLTAFNDEALYQAYRFRCGAPELTEALYRSSLGTLEPLRRFLTSRPESGNTR
jgi:hypothetical protein